MELSEDSSLEEMGSELGLEDSCEDVGTDSEEDSLEFVELSEDSSLEEMGSELGLEDSCEDVGTDSEEGSEVDPSDEEGISEEGSLGILDSSPVEEGSLDW